MSPLSPRLLAASLALAVGAAAAPALAQSGTERPGAAEQRSASFSAEELRSYAGAVTEVQRISAQANERLQEQMSAEQRDAIKSQATTRMVEAVREHDLSVQRYNQIYTAARTDPELAQRIDHYIGDAN